MNQALQKSAIIFGIFVLIGAAILLFVIVQATREHGQEQEIANTIVDDAVHESLAQEQNQPAPTKNPFLLPSIAVLPPQDIIVQEMEGAVHLRFGVTYANKGHGPLELTSVLPSLEENGDQESTVYQRVYRADGTTQDNEVGFFFWHNEHAHFHFTDFMEYELRPANNPQNPVFKEKITYCLRDKEFTYPDLFEAAQEKVYEDCGSEKQGISPGWSDTYEYDFPDQNIDISAIPTDLYELVVVFDPLEKLQELDRSDNTYTTLLFLDRQTNSVEIQQR